MAKRINHHLKIDGAPKVGYRRLGAAVRARRRIANDTGADINGITIYTCKVCGLLHTGRSRPRKGTSYDYSR